MEDTVVLVEDTPEPPPLTPNDGVTASASNAAPGKKMTFIRFTVRMRPNTNPQSIVDAVWQSCRNDGRFRCTHIGVRPDGDIGAVVDYVARGANANDVTRRLVRASGLTASQIQVEEMLTINLEAPVVIMPSTDELLDRGSEAEISVNILASGSTR